MHSEFAESALASVARNVNAATERLDFADEAISRGRELAAKPVAGEVGELVDCVRGAESALQQANTMLDAVDSAASDIRRAVSARCRRRSRTSSAASTRPPSSWPRAAWRKSAELSAARDAAVKAVTAPQSTGAADPLGAFTQLTQADADLDRLLAAVAEEREAAERLSRSYEQALFTAQSRVRSVSDYIDTRRGSIGPEARTRLNEAVRQLEAAQTKKQTNITEAIAHANGASLLAAQAQQLANDDVQAGQRAIPGALPRRTVRHGRDGRRNHPRQHPHAAGSAAAASAAVAAVDVDHLRRVAGRRRRTARRRRAVLASADELAAR